MKINLPASVMGIAFVAVLLAWCWGPVEPVTPPDTAMVALRDSVLRERVKDSVELVVRADSIIRLRDSALTAAYARKAASLRPRIIRIPSVAVAVQDSPVVRDSACVDGGDARAVLIGLEACEVDRDAFRGELVVCQASDSAKTLALAAKPSGYWRGFGHGAMVGGSAALAVCAAGR